MFLDRYGPETIDRIGEPLAAAVDLVLERLPLIRGEHVTAFLRETAGKVRRAGKKMQVHMHPDVFRPNPSPRERYWSLTNIDYDWRSWFSEGLVDGSIMRGRREGRHIVVASGGLPHRALRPP